MVNNLLRYSSCVLIRKTTNEQIQTENQKKSLSLLCVLMGHNSPITAFATTTYAKQQALISGYLSIVLTTVSLDGTLCAWSYNEFRCLKCVENLLKCIPHSVAELQPGKYLAFAGHHTEIEVVSLRKMKISWRLSGHTKPITSLSSIVVPGLGSAPPSVYLVSGSGDGVVHLWSSNKQEADHPIQTMCFDSPDVVSLHTNYNFKAVFIVTPKEWVLFSARDRQEILHVKCPSPSGWAGGMFSSKRSVILWTVDGNAYLYPIPPLDNLTPLSFGHPAKKTEKTEVKSPIATVKHMRSNSFIIMGSHLEDEVDALVDEIATKQQNTPNFRTSFLSKLKVVEVSDSIPPLCTFSFGLDNIKPKNLTFSGLVNGRLFVLGSSDGTVRAWVVPSTLDQIEDAGVLPWAVGCTADGWPNQSNAIRTPTSPVSQAPTLDNLSARRPHRTTTSFNIHGVTGSGPCATSSMILQELMFLIVGWDDGFISVSSIPFAKHNTKTAATQSHSGAVTCLMGATLSDNRHRLISGGNDATIRIWGIKEKGMLQLLFVFRNHTGAIVGLSTAPSSPSSFGQKSDHSVDHFFFSVSRDRSVGLFSLDNMVCKSIFGHHSTAVKSLYWRQEQDYLLISCEDNTLYIWEMSNGQLESKITDATSVEEILKFSTPIMTPDLFDANYEKLQKKGMMSFSYHFGEIAPVQIIYLNIRNLIYEMYFAQTGTVKPKATLKSSKSPSTTTSSPQPQTNHLIHLPAFLWSTYLLPWGYSPEIDSLCMDKFHLQPPNPEASFAFRGANGKMTVLAPSAGSGLGKWQFSEYLSAILTVSAVSYAKSLMSMSVFEANACSQLLTYYCTYLPESAQYVDPALSVVALYWRDSQDDILQAARTIFASTSTRLTPEQRKHFADTWAEILKSNSADQKLAILVLGILGSRSPDSLSPQLTGNVASELLKLLKSDTSEIALRVVAAELLGKGFSLWKQHIKDIDGLIHQLFSFTLVSNESQKILAETAHHALMLIGASEPRQFVLSLGHNIREAHMDNLGGKTLNLSQYPAAITMLGLLVKQDPISLLPLLPILVETVVKSLDPHLPYLRDSCLQATTKVLLTLVQQYPMVSFHQETQRLAVGTSETVIILYDLKTATRWHVLEGHDAPVSALCFSETGKLLASYSVEDCSMKMWQTSPPVFGFLGAGPYCAKTYPVAKVSKNLSQINLLESVKVKWNQNVSVTLTRSWDPNPNVFKY